jgi:dTDP-4-amino-4,6-dideoxygalactose transaminase
MINVTKAYLPDRNKYKDYVDQIFDSAWLTNNGTLLQQLEKRLASYLRVRNIVLVANGSLALQLCYKAMELSGEVITTPFSFVATTSTLAWEGLSPVFADIDSDTLNIDADKIAQCVTPQTSAILPVHVFGNPCEVEKIQAIADANDLKVIYDGAHAFGCQLDDQSVLNFGDATTLSFHATKLFHTIEGGAVITNDDNLAAKIRQMINFGQVQSGDIEFAGTNAKMNEFEAAMGLCVLDDIELIKSQRRAIWQHYQETLGDIVSFQFFNPRSDNNYAYAPVLFDSEAQLLKVQKRLTDNGIVPRRYFYPSLDQLKYLNGPADCHNSQDIASRILCLPMYPGMTAEQLENISQLVRG